MTIAGANVYWNVWKISYANDDPVGGAVITGTCAYTNIPGRLQQEMPQQLLVQQGLETQKTFTTTLLTNVLDIDERDELELARPTDHPFYGKFFRVVGVNYSSFNPRDPRNYMILSLVRSERAHANNLNQ